VDNPITLPNPRQNIQDSLRIYDSKPVLPRPVDNYAGASSVASLVFEVFDGLHEVAIPLACSAWKGATAWEMTRWACFGLVCTAAARDSYSITSSASESSLSGISMPCAFAVLRLMTNSNLMD
jgi:hypothetical protein